MRCSGRIGKSTRRIRHDEATASPRDDLFWEMIEWRPAADTHYFEILAERAAWVTYGESRQTSIRWRAGQPGEERLEKPNI